MNTTGRRILKNGSLVVVGLLVFGMMFGQIAGMWVASQAPVRNGLESLDGSTVATTDDMADQIKWRVPITMAGMGFTLVVLFEFVAGLWRPNTVPVTTPASKVADDELLMQKLLREAEQNPVNTPAPLGQLAVEIAQPIP